jgi:peptidoglycan/xylan/chitin deacetylase (PgdA/CDA1 family)
LRSMSNKSIRNFLFHRVSPERDELWDPMDVAHFEKCIKYISSHYEVIRAEQLPALKDEFQKHKYATISFDDGYKDNIEYALPVLDKYGIKASFYVTTDCIDKNIPTWTHLVEYLFQHTKLNKLNMDLDFVSDAFAVQELNSRPERIEYARKLIPYLKTLSHENRKRFIESIQQSFSDVQLPGFMMSWDDLKTLNAQGHYIGSHSVTHPLLDKIDNEEELRAELLDSGNAIKKNIGYFPITFSYPIGSYNAKVIELCKESGYEIGMATKQDIYDPRRDSIFEIPRIELPNEPWWKTLMRITNLLEDVKRKIYYRTHLLFGYGLYELIYEDAAISYSLPAL